MSEHLDFNRHSYQIERELGRNPTGGRVTYLATDISTNLPVVVKEFRFARSGASWAEYEAHQQEIKVLKRLDHPNIPLYLHDFESSDGFCLVQEYKKFPSLAQQSNFSPSEVKQIAIGILEILVYLQQQNPPVIHRDIKPENILVERVGYIQVYLVDFGFAFSKAEGAALSSTVKGTVGFMPPEQLFNHTLSAASDLYSLGATLICLLSGTPSKDIGKLIDQTYKFNLKSLPSNLSPRFINWLEKMVAPQIKNRFSNAAEALKALKPISIERDRFYLSETLRAFCAKIVPPVIGVASLGIAGGISSTLIGVPHQTQNLATNESIELFSHQNPSERLIETRECSYCDLRGAKLNGANLEGSRLFLANLEDANLQGAKLQGASLGMTSFKGAKLQGADLQGAHQENAIFERANLDGADLQGSNLSRANLRHAELRGANLDGSKFEDANLEEASLQGAKLQDSNLKYANLKSAYLNNANFKASNLNYANLNYAYLQSAYLRDANLEYAQLKGAALENADLEGANLQGADLQGADLRKANLKNANFQNANLKNANLQGVKGANLRGANLEGAILPNGKRAL